MFLFTELKRSRAMLVIAALLLACSLNLGASSQGKDKQAAKDAPPAGESGGQYVGSDTCQGCHEEIYKGFAASPHFQTTKPSKMAPGGHGCESCHGPGSAHVEGGGDKSKIFRFAGVSPEKVNERCMQCHQRTQEHGNWSRSPHATNGVSCISCHSPHHAREKRALLVSATPNLCYGCHIEQKADFAKPFRHRVNEGLVQCQDCHNPHGGYILQRARRTTPSQEEVCFKCHRDKQGPFLYEHVPVKTEGCTSCHTPHGSVNPRLLRVTPVNVLCLQCHTPAPNSATPALPSFHNQTQKYQACTMCHPMIHGSNAVDTFEY
jgi:DmsE family decaheme c-type cytochrome